MQKLNGDHRDGSFSKDPYSGARAEQESAFPGVLFARQDDHLPPSIPDHELLRLIGVGSYGKVWLGRNVLGSFRAVKVVYRQSFDHDRPFEREFQGLKQFEPVSHARESQVDIFQVGRNDAAGFFYYVMELADNANAEGKVQRAESAKAAARIPHSARSEMPTCQGAPQFYVPRTLKHQLQSHGALPVTDCVRIGLGLLRGLEHLHAHGLVHRDIKPSNIIFVGGAPKLADIGLVTSIDSTRSFVGTDGYIPPEGPGTPQADLYSLGKVLYECVTGKDRLDFPEIPTDWRTRPELNQLLEFNEILTRACDADPKQRYQSAREMAAEMVLLEHGHSVRRQRSRGMVWKRVRSLALATLVLGGAVAGATLLLRDLRPSQGHLPQALSTNEEALRLYEQSAHLLNGGPLQETLEACTNLLKAVELDPKFVGAYYRLFEATFTDWGDQLPPLRDWWGNLNWVKAKIHALSPDSAEDHLVNSWIAWGHWDFDRSVSEARLACKLSPRFQHAHTLYGWYVLVARGDAATAHREFKIAETIDYQDVLTQSMIPRAYYYERNFPEAIKRSLEAFRFERRSGAAHFLLMLAYEADGQYGKALDERETYELSRDGESKEATRKYAKYRQVLALQGPRGMWQAMLDDLSRSPSPDPYEKARLCARLGYTNEVFNLFKEARQSHTDHIMFLLWEDCWDGLRDDPRFDKALEEMHLPKVKPPGKPIRSTTAVSLSRQSPQGIDTR